MPLQNRVDPFGDLFATPARGTAVGQSRREIPSRRPNARLAALGVAAVDLLCAEFKNRQRNVWGRYYTELFFLDEVTAFAAGHRPCFECRRQDAELFAVLFSGKKQRASADAMDSVLHAERLDGKAKRTHRRSLDSLPDGAMVALDGEVFAVRGKHLLRWTPSGYSASKPPPSQS